MRFEKKAEAPTTAQPSSQSATGDAIPPPPSPVAAAEVSQPDDKKAAEPKIVDLAVDEKTALKQAQLVTQASFTFEWTSKKSGRQYVGAFTYERLLTRAQRRQWSQRYAQLCGGENLVAVGDIFGANMNDMQARLEASVVKAPDWWKPDELVDDEVIIALYTKVRAGQDSFRYGAVE